ncbi:hypothetical protein QE152_g25327 [Popillia japonica]|uniref:Uncharacterized protein n=1 Tax=Popillia japonica TaxID=7064 RepID=A0AAW1K294_POPJA
MPTTLAVSADNSSDEEDVAQETVLPAASMLWTSGQLHIPEESVQFQGSSNLPANVQQLESPYECFRYFFTDSLLDSIKEQSNLYAVQKNPNKQHQQRYLIQI